MGSAKLKQDKLRLTIRKPQGNRKSFAIVRDVITSEGRTQPTWENPTIDHVNRLYKEGSIGIDQAYKLLIGLRERELEKFYGPQVELDFNSVNEKLIKRHLDKANDRKLDKGTLFNIHIDCNRIMSLLGSDSLLDIKRSVLVKRLNSLKSKHGTIYKFSTREKILVRINILLKENGREDKEKDLLDLDDLEEDIYEENRASISFITEKELPLILKQAEFCKDPQIVKDAIIILFYTGLREGELFAVAEENWKKSAGHYQVVKQRTREFRLKDPKGSSKKKGPKTRSALVPPKCVESFERWMSLDIKIRKDLRQKLSIRVKQAAKRAWPKVKEKHISNHDLRHSAAINYLAKGFTLTATAGKLGHTEKVCREYYAGWIVTDEEATFLNNKLG